MKKELIAKLHRSFEALVHVEEETGVEFWLARDLQPLLDYRTWRRFEEVIRRGISACETSGYDPRDHFARVGKMILLGKGALPTITIKAKDFANEITNFNVKRDDLRTEAHITNEHVQNNREVRGVLANRGITPEALPPGEDVKKVERRLASEQKKLPKQVKPLDSAEDGEGS